MFTIGTCSDCFQTFCLKSNKLFGEDGKLSALYVRCCDNDFCEYAKCDLTNYMDPNAICEYLKELKCSGCKSLIDNINEQTIVTPYVFDESIQKLRIFKRSGMYYECPELSICQFGDKCKLRSIGCTFSHSIDELQVSESVSVAPYGYEGMHSHIPCKYGHKCRRLGTGCWFGH